MEASELRIGNFYNQFTYITEVDWPVLKELKDAPLDQLWCKPIPLTEEWLLKFGFENKNGKFLINIDDRFKVCVAVRIDKWYLYNDDFDSDCNIICKVEAVHRLQNLFFDIWNIELIIK
jgi:hypothetical protein